MPAVCAELHATVSDADRMWGTSTGTLRTTEEAVTVKTRCSVVTTQGNSANVDQYPPQPSDSDNTIVANDDRWLCAPCSDGLGQTAERECGNLAGKKPRGRPCRKRSRLNEEEPQVKHYDLWPYRYFGSHTNPEDTVDKDEALIFPIVKPRVGSEYQACVPDKPTEDAERGDDGTVEALSLVNTFSENEVGTLESIIRREAISSDQTHSVDWLMEIVHRATEAHHLGAHHLGMGIESVSMKEPMRLERWKKQPCPYADKEWDAKEITIFKKAVSRHFDDLRAVREELDDRSLPEVVRLYGTSMTDETVMSVGLRQIDSVGGAGPVGDRTCGTGKREGELLTSSTAKRLKIIGPRAPDRSTLPAIVDPDTSEDQYMCVSCFTKGPRDKVLKCNECGVTLHAGACGAVLCQPSQVDTWLCELCENEKTQRYRLNTDCLLCPRPQKLANENGLNGTGTTPSDTYLRACKPTEGHGWVHLLCAVFISEVQFSDSSKLKIVEGVNSISEDRWRATCDLCNSTGGAVVQCGNCPKEYHVSCAWKAGHKFGFDIVPVKKSRQDATNVVTFKREKGVMKTVVCCKDHSAYHRNLFGICDKDDVGETALQLYAREYKQPPRQAVHPLLRKAHRLDQLLQTPHHDSPSFLSEETAMNENPVCTTCKTEYSPFFHPAPTDSTQWLCHQCYFLAQARMQDE